MTLQNTTFSRRFFLFMLAAAAASLPAQTLDTVRVEPNHSTIGFVVPIAGGMTKVTGKFTEFEVLLLCPEPVTKDLDLTKCAIFAAIKVASINTGNAGRDRDLQGEGFFAAAKFPEITFQGRRIWQNENQYVLAGDLTMRGKTKAIELPVAVTGTSATEDGRPVWGFATGLQINRKEFGIGTNWVHSAIPNFLGEEITVQIDLWTRPPRKN